MYSQLQKVRAAQRVLPAVGQVVVQVVVVLVPLVAWAPVVVQVLVLVQRAQVQRALVPLVPLVLQQQVRAPGLAGLEWSPE